MQAEESFKGGLVSLAELVQTIRHAAWPVAHPFAPSNYPYERRRRKVTRKQQAKGAMRDLWHGRAESVEGNCAYKAIF
jgi:hypothetical protein